MKRKNIIEGMLLRSELPGELLPSMPLIEIIGRNRVLIENHMGISCYSRCDIVVKVQAGEVKVCGENLELREMSKEQLVIVGEIYSVSILDGR